MNVDEHRDRIYGLCTLSYAGGGQASSTAIESAFSSGTRTVAQPRVAVSGCTVVPPGLILRPAGTLGGRASVCVPDERSERAEHIQRQSDRAMFRKI